MEYLEVLFAISINYVLFSSEVESLQHWFHISFILFYFEGTDKQSDQLYNNSNILSLKYPFSFLGRWSPIFLLFTISYFCFLLRTLERIVTKIKTLVATYFWRILLILNSDWLFSWISLLLKLSSSSFFFLLILSCHVPRSTTIH